MCVYDFIDYVFFFQAEDGIRDLVRSRGLGDVYKRQVNMSLINQETKKLRNFGLLFSGIFAALGCYKVYNLSLIHI